MTGRSEHVDAVVVGSGFGGAVASYRLAEAGRSVVVLERGKAYPPGDFARTPAQLGTSFWDPSEGLHGLFDVWTFRGLEGVVSSGLGGGSLIYANVLLRKDEHWFVHDSPLPGGGYENWPVSRADLDPHYDAVEAMLGATPYPYPNEPKTAAMRESAARLGLHYEYPPLAVTFAPAAGSPPVFGAQLPTPAYGNIHGLPRRTCRLCGECDLGCNDGAKNTLDHTYLSAAKHHGADIRTLTEVKGLSPLPGGGYEVRFVVHDEQRPPGGRARQTLHRITCDRLVLGAGTFGTTFLLLRNRSALPGLSRALGTRFSGNGDLLGFLVNAKDPKAAGGYRHLHGSRGPVITGTIRVGDAHDGDGSTGRGYYIQDAGYPVFADWLVETSQLKEVARRGARFAWSRLNRRLSRSPKSGLSPDMAALIGPANLSDSSLPLLGMGRDVADGVMGLRKGYLDVKWTTTTSEEYFSRVRQTMDDIAGDLGASLQDNPIWWTKRVITVHPLGGAPIGSHVAEGVCDPHGEVFGFPGLYVLDGAALPGPVGANPALTIAALSNRACERMLESAPVVRRATRVPAPPPTTTEEVMTAPRDPRATSLSFTEEMKGFVSLGVADPEEGERQGRHQLQKLMFHLTITADDVERFVAEPQHQGSAVGYLECDALGGRLPVEAGWFNLFTSTQDAAVRQMLYRLHFCDLGGNPLTFVGHKTVRDDPGFDVWRDTSTLYFRIHRGHVPPQDVTHQGNGDAVVVAAGVITIHLPDFLRQMTTFRTDGPQPAAALEGFARLFLGQLWEVYGPRIVERADRR